MPGIIAWLLMYPRPLGDMTWPMCGVLDEHLSCIEHLLDRGTPEDLLLLQIDAVLIGEGLPSILF